MKFYLDITLLPDAEANLGFIWQKVYQQIHLALVENKTANGNSTIAISFPEYGNGVFPLGNKLRLLASNQEMLKTLEVTKWLNGLNDYVHCTSIKGVPLNVTTFACFSRKQVKRNMDRLARRRAKRKQESLKQALQYYADFNDQNSKLPFVNIVSLSSNDSVKFSNKNKFRLFINKETFEKSYEGEYSCYGLSNTATVPWF
jgi:CRISPR-associated endonuclease Csy4